jgi:hypothetical protein
MKTDIEQLFVNPMDGEAMVFPYLIHVSLPQGIYKLRPLKRQQTEDVCVAEVFGLVNVY